MILCLTEIEIESTRVTICVALFTLQRSTSHHSQKHDFLIVMSLQVFVTIPVSNNLQLYRDTTHTPEQTGLEHQLQQSKSRSTSLKTSESIRQRIKF